MGYLHCMLSSGKILEFYKLQQEKKRYLVIQTKNMAIKLCEKICVFQNLIVVMESVEV